MNQTFVQALIGLANLQAIFILSDGHSCDNMEKGVCTEEFNGLTSLARTIENGQISLEKSGVSRASIFTFSLGHNAQNGVMRQLACMHNGIWAEYTGTSNSSNQRLCGS